MRPLCLRRFLHRLCESDSKSGFFEDLSHHFIFFSLVNIFIQISSTKDDSKRDSMTLHEPASSVEMKSQCCLQVLSPDEVGDFR